MMDPEHGDILLTLVLEGEGGPAEPGKLSRLIQYFTRTDTLWTPSHAALFVNREEVIEAIVPHVAISPFAKYRDGGAQWMVLRIPALSEVQRAEVVEYAIHTYLGKDYDFAKLGLEALDAGFHTTWWARAFGIERAPICSVVLAASLKHRGGWRFRDHKTGEVLPTNAVTPNAILAHAKQWPQDLMAIAGVVG